MAELQYLEWDSKLFRRKVGSIHLPAVESVSQLPAALAQGRQEGYTLVYVHARPGITIPPEVMGEFDGRQVPTRVELGREADSPVQPINYAIGTFPPEADWKELVSLGRSSGLWSRFFTDPSIPRRDFEALYDTWVERSVRREIAEEVIVHRTEKRVDGLVTIAMQEQVGKIGLIAVDEAAKGRGIATSLIEAAWRYAKKIGASKMSVVTQEENVPAMGLYAKCGFNVLQREETFHFL